MFDRKNIVPLRLFGWTVMLTGVVLIILHAIADSGSQTYIFHILLGIFINILSEIFILGIKIKEEQDLTI